MARLFIDGLEQGNRDAFTRTGGTGNFMVYGSPPTGFSGSYYMQGEATFGNSYAEVDLSPSKAEIYGALKLSVASTNVQNKGVLAFYDSGGTTVIGSIILVWNSPNFTVRALRGGQNGTTLATGSITFGADTVILLEFWYKPLNSGGVFQVKVNGTLDINYSGDTTDGLENVARVRYGYQAVNVARLNFDDMVLDDANWIGNTRIQKLQISGAGTTTEWDASTGSPYQCIDEISYNDSDYVSTNVVNESLTCACANMTGNVAAVKCLVLYGRMAYEGNPTPTKQKLSIRVNETEYYGSDESPSLSFAKATPKMWELNPDDAAAWEEADINAIEIGVRSVT